MTDESSAVEWWRPLREEWGLDFRRAEDVVGVLTRGPATLSDLVRQTAVDRRGVQRVLGDLGTLVRIEAGERYALTGDPQLDPGVRERPDLESTLAKVRRELSPDRADLDHVSATAATMAARARYFADRYDLVGRTVLCIGDHDLTSIAVTVLEPRCRALVVDVDPGVLAVLSRARDRLGLDVTIASADLRLGLPRAFDGAADLAFTDPPYTSDGVQLFLARCVEGLRESGHERVSFAYGFADSQVSRGQQTQAVVGELKLAYEAVLPGFNRFDGAEAIGAASELYVCRPTRWSRPAARRAAGASTRIYTRGSAATESSVQPLPAAVIGLADADRSGDDARVLVGGLWPDAEAPHRDDGRRMDLARFLTEPAEHERPKIARRSAAVNLTPYFDGALRATLLAGLGWHDVTVVTSFSGRNELASHHQTARLLSSVAEVTIATHGRSYAVLRLRRTEGAAEEPSGAERLLRRLALRAHARVLNVWREELIAIARRSGRTLTKRAALSVIDDALAHPSLLALRLIDLAEPDLDDLLRAVPRTVRAVTDD